MMTQAETLYFQHIPKTAGSSVKAWLANCLETALCAADIADHLMAIPRQELAQYRAFAGHFHCYLAPYLGRELVTVTVLRDPLPRTRSHWHQVRRHKQHPHHARVIDQTFGEFVVDDRNRVMIEDYQARYLVRPLIDMRVMAADLSEEELSRFTLSEALEQASLSVNKSTLASDASETLRSMAAVGTCEQLGDFLAKVGKILDISPPDVVPRENVTEGDVAAELSASELMRIRDMTRIDQDLYDSVRGGSYK